MTQYRVLNGEQAVAELLGQNQTFEPYYGEKAKSKKDPATNVTTGTAPINVILSLHHMTRIGAATNADIIELVNLMTPGMNFWCGLTSPVPKYAQDVCMPELRRQLPAEIFSTPLPEDGDLDRFYREMVERFGEKVEVKSIAKPVA